MANELIFYKTPDGEQRIEVVYQDENFWMSQGALAELFDVKCPAITKHLGNIFSTGELMEAEVCSILEHTTQHGAIELQALKQLKPRFKRLRNSVHTWLDELSVITQRFAERSSRIDQSRSRHQSRQMARFPSSKRRQITNRDKNHDTLSRFGVMQAAHRLIATFAEPQRNRPTPATSH